MAAAPVPMPIHLRKSRRVTRIISLASLVARVPNVPAVPIVQAPTSVLPRGAREDEGGVLTTVIWQFLNPAKSSLIFFRHGRQRYRSRRQRRRGLSSPVAVRRLLHRSVTAFGGT